VTRRIGKVVIIEPEAWCTCARCGMRAECRDVLGNGQPICFDCATDEEKDSYGERMFGSEDEE